MGKGFRESLCLGSVTSYNLLGFAQRTAEGGCPHIPLPKSLSLRFSQFGQHYGSKPKTATPFGVPTKTFPFRMVGVMNLLPLPNWSRPLAAWLLL